MITDSELRIANESYTHKDFYQIYPELLDIVNKITERWDPSASNESDPGVVLLKLLAFIGDKVNYNIDKNILECFMPSATQEDSMRKLCDMMGYNMHYYKSATVDVSFMWSGDQLNTPSSGNYIRIPRFTGLSDDAGEVNYVLTEEVILNAKGEAVTKKAIQGQLIDLAINNGSVIKLYNLDDNRRLYLPEIEIAENGIWIWNNTTEASQNIEKALFWDKVDNLNTQPAGNRVWKFGYDSKKKLPYILFPEDISELIGDGLRLKYIKTLGSSGNIRSKTLTKLANETKVIYINESDLTETEIDVQDDNGNSYLTVQNNSYTLNGENVETIDDAYNSFKKTIGTFDTLVTCRDYANKIYNMVISNTDQSNLVSNVQVTDIRDDINFSNTVCTFNEYGLVYETISEKINYDVVNHFEELPTASDSYVNTYYYVTDINSYFKCLKKVNDDSYNWILVSEDDLKRINHFDLYIYPLNPTKPMNLNSEKIIGYTGKNYLNTFKPNASNVYEITSQLNNFKTISHNIKQIPLKDSSNYLNNIYLIKNYYHLKAKITTNYKVLEYEANQILKNVYVALYENFNARNIDYGNEIPFDSLLKVIEQADPRIKSVALEEPELTTKAMLGDSTEYVLKLNNSSTSEGAKGEALYYRLLAKNVLAGKLPLFNYDNRFKYSIGQVNIQNESTEIYGKVREYPFDGPNTKPIIEQANMDKYSITHLSTGVDIPTEITKNGYSLKANEVVQLIAPNLQSNPVYPAYVNYYFKLGNRMNNAVPCKLTKIFSNDDQQDYTLYLNAEVELGSILYTYKHRLEIIPDESGQSMQERLQELIEEKAQEYNKLPENAIWRFDNQTAKYVQVLNGNEYVEGETYYYADPLTKDNLFILEANYGIDYCLYTSAGVSILNIPGKLVDENKMQYKYLSPSNYMGQPIYGKATNDDTLGLNESAPYIKENTEYRMGEGDILYINYTDSNDIVHNIEYYGSSSNCYYIENGVEANKHYFSGIIKPSFNLYDSELYHTADAGHRYSKTEGYWSGWETKINGMFTLQGTEEIAMRDFVKTEIKMSPFYCYWICKNNNTLIFKGQPVANTDKYNDFTYMLDNNEYFFYTDSIKNTLTTLGSGTTLKIHYSEPQTNNEIQWKLKSDNELDLNDVANNGIGAFSDTAWEIKDFNDNKILSILENQIITLGEDDVISNVEFIDNIQNSTGIIDNEWKQIDATIFTYNSKNLPIFNNFIDNNVNWKIRSSLSLNIGPKLTQQLITDQNNVKQWIKLNTSAWKDPNTKRYQRVEKDTDLSRLIFEIIPLGTDANGQNQKTFTSGYFRCNHLLQELGGDFIPVQTFGIDGTERDDLMIYEFNSIEPKVISQKESDNSGDQNLEVNDLTLDDPFSKLSFDKIDYAYMPVYIPKDAFGLLMFYYIPNNADSNQNNMLLESYSNWNSPLQEPSQEQEVDALMYYKDSNSESLNYAYQIAIKPGINIIRIKNSCYLKLLKSNPDDTSGIVLFSNLDIAKIDSEDLTGINYELLNIPKTKCKEFLEKLKSLTGSDNFYYNAPISLYNQIDTKKYDEYTWFSSNNIANKFVMSELDVDFSDIQIAKSSRVN